MGQKAMLAEKVVNEFNDEMRVLYEQSGRQPFERSALKQTSFYEAATLRMQAVLIGAIEDLATILSSPRVEVEPLTAEESIPQTNALIELMRRKQELRNGRIADSPLKPVDPKARVSKENPPRTTPEKKSDG